MKNLNFIILLLGLLFTACQQDFEDVTEDLATTPSGKERFRMIKTLDPQPYTKAVILKDKLWQNGDTIKIKFLNGLPELQEKVKQNAAIWLKYANLHFEYVEEDADVKIGFDWGDKGISWSTIGKDCQKVPQNEPSLNLLYLQGEEDETIIRAEVLRGFGHILGLGFEHLSPSSSIIFNSRALNFL